MTLIEAWESVRRSHGDDIAQQAIMKTYDTGKLEGIGYFLSEVSFLRKSYYTDGMEAHRRSDGSYVIGVQYSALPLSVIALVEPKAPDPASIVELREEVRSWPKHRLRQLRPVGWKPPIPIVLCYYCHGNNVVKYGKGRSGVQRYHCKSVACGKVFEEERQALLSQGSKVVIS